MPGCSYATAHPPIESGIFSLSHTKKVGSSINLCQAKLIVTSSFLPVPTLTVQFFFTSLLVGEVSALFARSFSKNSYKFKNEIKIPTTVSRNDS